MHGILLFSIRIQSDLVVQIEPDIEGSHLGIDVFVLFLFSPLWLTVTLPYGECPRCLDGRAGDRSGEAWPDVA